MKGSHLINPKSFTFLSFVVKCPNFNFFKNPVLNFFKDNVFLICNGPNGFSTNTGATGSTGYTGYTGPQGIPGAATNTGATGYTGPIGYTGYTGPAGFATNTGTTGYTGYTGPIGYTGPTGPRGDFGGVSFKYSFSSDTTSTDPGSGFLKLNSRSVVLLRYSEASHPLKHQRSPGLSKVLSMGSLRDASLDST